MNPAPHPIRNRPARGTHGNSPANDTARRALTTATVLGVLSLAAACEDPATPGPTAMTSGPSAGQAPGPAGDTPAAAVDAARWVEVTTDAYVVKPGEERNVCFVQTLPTAINVDRFEYESQPGIHHMLFNRLTKPESRSSFECNVLFKPTWQTLFGTGTTGQDLEFPRGAAQILPEGTQVLVQLHLLNATSEDLSVSATVRMRHSVTPDPTPIGMFVFGSDDIDIPAGGESTTVADCTTPGELRIAAVLPHMHYLGRKLTLELRPPGDPAAPMVEFYRREPWDFDNQYVDRVDATIAAGTAARLTCGFRNDTTSPVTFGDSSHDEMCFLVTYIVGESPGSCTTITNPARLQALFADD